MKDRYYLPLILLIIVDYFVISFSFLAAYGIRFYTGLYDMIPPEGVGDFNYYLPVAFIVGFLGVLIFERTGLYHQRVGLDRHVWPGLMIIATVIAYIFIMAILFNYRGYTYNRMAVALGIPVTAGSIILVHYILKQAQFFLIRKGIIFSKTLLIGPQDRCSEVLQKLQEYHGSQYQVLGYMTTEKTQSPSQNLACLGNIDELEKLLQPGVVDNVIIAMHADNHQEILRVMATCLKQKVEYRLIPELYDLLYQRLTIEEFQALPTVMLGESPLHGFGFALKRSMDVLISGIALVVSAPLMFLIAAMIKLDSKGPVLFVQERVGNDGRRFFIYKFRSMIDEAERDTGPKWATANDPRTTRIGRFIRRYNLDELPQFVNVLRGDMSLVGPRPERPFFVNKFKEEIPLYMRRHMVKAGLTGLAQVHGWRGDTSVDERTNFDLYYVQNWSLLLDLKIILRTLTSFKNAY